MPRWSATCSVWPSHKRGCLLPLGGRPGRHQAHQSLLRRGSHQLTVPSVDRAEAQATDMSRPGTARVIQKPVIGSERFMAPKGLIDTGTLHGETHIIHTARPNTGTWECRDRGRQKAYT